MNVCVMGIDFVSFCDFQLDIGTVPEQCGISSFHFIFFRIVVA